MDRLFCGEVWQRHFLVNSALWGLRLRIPQELNLGTDLIVGTEGCQKKQVYVPPGWFAGHPVAHLSKVRSSIGTTFGAVVGVFAAVLLFASYGQGYLCFFFVTFARMLVKETVLSRFSSPALAKETHGLLPSTVDKHETLLDQFHHMVWSPGVTHCE